MEVVQHATDISHSALEEKTCNKDKFIIQQGFVGIGPARARLLLERYGTLTGVFLPLTDIVKNIPGIGSKIIRKIMQVME